MRRAAASVKAHIDENHEPTPFDKMVTVEDPHDQQLIENCRPSGWVNPMPAKKYNLVVIGGGTAGLVSAAGAAGLGAKSRAHRAQFIGRRLFERRLRAVKRHHSRRARGGRSAGRRRIRNHASWRSGNQFFRRHGAHAQTARRYQRARFRRALHSARRRRIHRQR